MPWPDKILRQFQTVPPNPREKEFHGPYNKLLNTLFPPDSDFTVIPQYLEPASSKSSDFIVAFEVSHQNKPVFILELKSPADLDFISARQSADQQVRERLGDLAAQCPIPTLRAVSAMGTKLCFYQLDVTSDDADIIPLAIARHLTRVNDTAPLSRWNYNILEPAGEQKFRTIVDEIMAECAQLP